MAYEKRVCVMKQIKKGFTADGGALSGAIYAERMGENVKVTPRLLGLAPVLDGRYVLVLHFQKRSYCLDFSGGMLDEFEAPSIKDGFCALLCYVRTGNAEPVAYGACGKENASAESLLAAVNAAGSEKKKRRPANPLPPNELPAPMPNVPLAPTPIVPEPIPDEGETADEAPFRDRLAAVYDDEAIAVDDFYARDAHANASGKNKEETVSNAGGGDSGADEAVPPRPASRGSLTYYAHVREKLTAAFQKFPRDRRLLPVFPASEWANTGEALLGVIYENGTPRYLCVARETPFPEEAEEKGSFVPLSQFSDEQGMYVVFQDADTGAYVKVHDA